MNDPGSTTRNGSKVPRVGILGASLGTGNLGVDALGASIVQGLVECCPDISIAYQTWTDAPVNIPLGSRQLRCEPLVVRRHSTWRRPNGVEQIRRFSRLEDRVGKTMARPIASFSSTWQRLKSLDAVLDVSAGDSFADIYGDDVFWYQSQVKLMCLDMGIPLVLMPQTYGPFNQLESREVAAEILSAARLVGTREASGEREIRELCSPGNLPPVVQTPDLAFLLEPQQCDLPAATTEHLRAKAGPIIGINVSGLLYFDRRDFGLAAKHSEVIDKLIEWALRIDGSRVLLVPHVISLGDAEPSSVAPSNDADRTDTGACAAVYGRLLPESRGRVDVLSSHQTPAQAKYAMARCDFFLGARMHSFVGASSQCVPGALLAYSKKAEGMTASIGIESSVVDLRTCNAQQVVDEVAKRYATRGELAARLEQIMPNVKATIRQFFTGTLLPVLQGRAPTISTGAPSPAVPTTGCSDSLTEDATL